MISGTMPEHRPRSFLSTNLSIHYSYIILPYFVAYAGSSVCSYCISSISGGSLQSLSQDASSTVTRGPVTLMLLSGNECLIQITHLLRYSFQNGDKYERWSTRGIAFPIHVLYIARKCDVISLHIRKLRADKIRGMVAIVLIGMVYLPLSSLRA
jgi:hypothetical protein